MPGKPVTNRETAFEAWGNDPPAWIIILAEACDTSNQTQVAKRLGRSSPFISRVLRNRYPADLAEVEGLVRSTLTSDTVHCPIIDAAIPLTGCRRNRRREGPPVNLLFQACAARCPTCPHNTDAKAAA